MINEGRIDVLEISLAEADLGVVHQVI
jgi:hypothetical protein